MRVNPFLLAGLFVALFSIALSEDAALRDEEAKVAAVARIEEEIKETSERKAKASKNREREAVKILSQELKRLQAQLNKAKAKSPEQHAEEAAAADVAAKRAAEEKRQAEEMVAFWAAPKGRATVAAARLYRDLQKFRHQPDFIEMGFGHGGPYYHWLTAAETVARWDGKVGAAELGQKYDCSLGELSALGMAYAFSRGEDTPYTIDVEKRLGPAMRAIEKAAEERAKEKAKSHAP